METKKRNIIIGLAAVVVIAVVGVVIAQQSGLLTGRVQLPSGQPVVIRDPADITPDTGRQPVGNGDDTTGQVSVSLVPAEISEVKVLADRFQVTLIEPEFLLEEGQRPLGGGLLEDRPDLGIGAGIGTEGEGEREGVVDTGVLPADTGLIDRTQQTFEDLRLGIDQGLDPNFATDVPTYDPTDNIFANLQDNRDFQNAADEMQRNLEDIARGAEQAQDIADMTQIDAVMDILKQSSEIGSNFQDFRSQIAEVSEQIEFSAQMADLAASQVNAADALGQLAQNIFENFDNFSMNIGMENAANLANMTARLSSGFALSGKGMANQASIQADFAFGAGDISGEEFDATQNSAESTETEADSVNQNAQQTQQDINSVVPGGTFGSLGAGSTPIR